MHKGLYAIAAALLLFAPDVAGCAHAQARAQTTYGLGRAADPADIMRENIDVAPDGNGLPSGRGDAVDGAAIFATSCRSCHGTAIQLSPKRWPYATTLFDYIRRAMPPLPAHRLDANGVYAVTAYELYMNGILQQDDVIDKIGLARITMPGSADFIQHP